MTAETQNAYDRAVGQFTELVSAPSQQVVRNPAELAKQAGIPSSSGRRHAEVAEGLGVLHRETTGAYRNGPMLLRVGLSAFGFGRFAFAALPLLVGLRQNAGLTAFLYVQTAEIVKIGPYSMGRSRDFVRPPPEYVMVPPSVDAQVDGEIRPQSLTDGLGDRRQPTLMRHVARYNDNFCGLGLLLLNQSSSMNAHASEALARTATRLTDIDEG